jgi:hypothetical protein
LFARDSALHNSTTAAAPTVAKVGVDPASAASASSATTGPQGGVAGSQEAHRPPTAAPASAPDTRPVADLPTQAGADAGSANPPETGTPALAKRMYKQFLDQPRDHAWASAAERQLQAHLASISSDLSPWFEHPAVECRKTICAIQATSRSAGDSARDAQAWHDAMYTLPRQPWWRDFQFREPATQLATAADGKRPLFITFVLRADGAGPTQ